MLSMFKIGYIVLAMKNIITIDVGNIPPNEVDDYMEEMICYYNNIPYVKKKKNKNWIYDLFDILGIAGSFGG